ncbi:Cytochrome b-c1 complex subunit 1, mitochondrial [Fukomys damarensis]|uniref:Cytochrome b-c1 complex subunit 1, mitochondrial n=1 Tax=Fukomys damarensis TaxID=885580 RepID=A0A091CLW0_FUKDA|nr:Cytochrome b-c1 complex subunit 1, mitochondrial [Fukomys damarensis]
MCSAPLCLQKREDGGICICICQNAGVGAKVWGHTGCSVALLKAPSFAEHHDLCLGSAGQAGDAGQQAGQQAGHGLEHSAHPTCTVGVWIDADSYYETEKYNGTGYSMEHLLSREHK